MVRPGQTPRITNHAPFLKGRTPNPQVRSNRDRGVRTYFQYFSHADALNCRQRITMAPT
jgi:hypothetical protein